MQPYAKKPAVEINIDHAPIAAQPSLCITLPSVIRGECDVAHKTVCSIRCCLKKYKEKDKLTKMSTTVEIFHKAAMYWDILKYAM